MEEKELLVYHIVTRNKMYLGQIIFFDKNQNNTLYRFFFEREHLNSKGEDFIQILQDNGSLLTKEDGVPFSRKIEQAREYWEGKLITDLPELLVNGKIEVIEIIDDFTTIEKR